MIKPQNVANNTNNNLYVRIEALETENTRLRNENQQLRHENHRLRNDLVTLMSNLDARIAEVVAPLNDEISRLTKENLRLQSIIDKNSGNSSKPPSTDKSSPRRKPIHNNRESTGRQPGGQHGHPGHRLSMPEQEKFIEMIEQGIAQVEVVDHTGGSTDYVVKWVVEVDIVTVFKKHLFKRGEVPPEYNNEVTYGDSVKSLALLLNTESYMGVEQLSKVISYLTSGVVNLSDATILKFTDDFAASLTDEIAAIKEDLLAGPVINTDDSPMRCAQTLIYDEDGQNPKIISEKGKSYQVTTRTYVNEDSALFTVNPKKDIDGVERDAILTEYDGIICHDHDTKFYNFGGRIEGHGDCGAHLLRTLKGLQQLHRVSWAGEAREFFKSMNTYKNNDLDNGATSCDPKVLAMFEKKYDALVLAGKIQLNQMDEKAFGYSEFRAMLNRLTVYKTPYMLFMRDYAVPFTNNAAERSLRAEKNKEKISGCFRSWQGIANYVKIRSFVSTLKMRGINLMRSIQSIFQGKPVLA